MTHDAGSGNVEKGLKLLLRSWKKNGQDCHLADSESTSAQKISRVLVKLNLKWEVTLMGSLFKYTTEEYTSGQTNTQAECCLRQHQKTRENLRGRVLALRESEIIIALLLQPREGNRLI